MVVSSRGNHITYRKLDKAIRGAHFAQFSESFRGVPWGFHFHELGTSLSYAYACITILLQRKISKVYCGIFIYIYKISLCISMVLWYLLSPYTHVWQ